MLIKVLKQVNDFLDQLQKRQRADVDAVLEDAKEYGLKAPLISMRQIRGKLWEMRISKTRIFYVMIERETMILLHAYKKQGQKAPRHEIETALRRMGEFEEL